MRGKRNEESGSNPNTPSTEFEIGYIYRIVEEDINAFADQSSNRLSGPNIATRVGAILIAKARRQLLRVPDSVRRLRGSSGEGNSAMESVEVAALPHQDPPPVGKKKRVLSQTARNRIAAAQRARWAKYHKEKRSLPKKASKAKSRRIHSYWMKMTAAERSIEMQRRQAVARQNKNRAA